MRDPHASYDMVPDEVLNNLSPDPEITELEARRDELQNSSLSVYHSPRVNEFAQIPA